MLGLTRDLGQQLNMRDCACCNKCYIITMATPPDRFDTLIVRLRAYGTYGEIMNTMVEVFGLYW